MSGIHVESIYAAPPAAVWAALTDSEELADWLMPNDFVLELGHRFNFWTKPRPGFDGIVECEVLEIVPEKRLSYTWNGAGQQTIVTWELQPHGNGTKLTLRQTGFTRLTGAVSQFTLGLGWKKKFRTSLRAVIERSSPRPRRQ